MKNTVDYLNNAKKKLGIKSDRQLAIWMGVGTPTLSQYQSGKRIIDDYAAAKIAEALNIDEMEVIAVANIEREKTEERRTYWRKVFARHAGTGVAACLVLSISMININDVQASESTPDLTNYTLCEV